ncbi:uncharacterized protein LOC130990395 [Salvia miltiorrhiza]|uniref:uncharacterized protein LOC130990395 n=1 Tax=Salvia miltiorrhiza TaxID=226208 RepID=UPI0025ABD977|nr:uncharacterized protein LOC130990395 [Salvia miltiorrhiza]
MWFANLHGISITDRLTAVSESLSIWASHARRNAHRTKNKLQNQISALQGRSDSFSISKMSQVRKELAEVLLREEAHLRQRAKQHWLKDGDSNTRFFHAMASSRKKKNSIAQL